MRCFDDTIVHPNTTHFRFVDGHPDMYNGGYWKPYRQEFKTVKETPCGCWIISVGSYSEKYATRKWVSNTGRKRYAYPTQKEAIDSYRIRKWKQIGHAQNSIEKAKAMLIHTGVTEKEIENTVLHWRDFE